MDALVETLVAWGLPGMFLSAMLAGSVVPFSSELVLAGLVKLGVAPMACLLAAGLGNTAGGLTCYYVGRMGTIDWMKKYLKVSEEKIERAVKFLQGKGAMMGFFAFLPGVGEVIAIALGFMRSNVALTTAAMFIGKTLRYAIIVYLVMKI